MDVQEIIVFILGIAAAGYLVYFFYKQTKSHKCDDCGLMEMHKESQRKKSAKSK